MRGSESNKDRRLQPRKKKEGQWKFDPGKLNQSSKKDHIRDKKTKEGGHDHTLGTTKLSLATWISRSPLPLLDPDFLILP